MSNERGQEGMGRLRPIRGFDPAIIGKESWVLEEGEQLSREVNLFHFYHRTTPDVYANKNIFFDVILPNEDQLGYVFVNNKGEFAKLSGLSHWAVDTDGTVVFENFDGSKLLIKNDGGYSEVLSISELRSSRGNINHIKH